MPRVFFQKRLKNVKFKKIREQRDVFGFLITQFFLIIFEEKKMWVTFSRFLRKTELFRKCLVSL